MFGVLASDELGEVFVEIAAVAGTGLLKIGADILTDKKDGVMSVLDVAFLRMEGKTHTGKKRLDGIIDESDEIVDFGWGDDKIKIIDIATVMFDFEVELDEAIKQIHVDVGEKLGGEIADGEAAPVGLIKKTFVARDSFPIFPGTFDDTVILRTVVDDFAAEILP